MKNILFSLFILLIANSLSAQIGMSAAYKTFNPEDWFSVQGKTTVSPYTGYNIGVDYWFRLKNQRVEFLPELSFGQHSGEFGEGELSADFLNFQFNTNIYFLDFNNDCNCPTFDKGGNFFTKGFFIQLAPGFSRISLKNQLDPNDEVLFLEDDINAFSFGLGAGVDFGLSQLITLTPLARFHFYPSVETTAFVSSTSERSVIKQLYLGMHLGIRWNDGSNSGGGRRGRSLSGRRR